MTNPRRNFLTIEGRALCPMYANAELLWYLSRSNKTEMLQFYAPSYKKFTEDDGTAYGAYGYRIANNIQFAPLTQPNDQLRYAVQRFQRDPNTRQLVISLWKPDDLITEGRRDMPCTICWNFRLHDNNLHMITYMRSNDAWLGFPYDVYCFTAIQQIMAGSLGCGVGDYVHNVGSMHLYENNKDDVHNILEDGVVMAEHNEYTKPSKLDQAEAYCKNEQIIRAMEGWPIGTDPRPLDNDNSLLADAVRCCAQKKNKNYSGPKSPALAKGFAHADRRRSRLSGKDSAG